MRIVPVALALFYRTPSEGVLEVWTQVREDDGIYHGLLEFPGGGIEEGETPLVAAIREVEEEVGILVNADDAQFMGIYPNHHSNKTILLNVFLFPDQVALKGKGKWLEITKEKLSSPYQGQIPGPNHLIIDDLFRSLYS
jgi:8-oxo-dGTP diphosphatase